MDKYVFVLNFYPISVSILYLRNILKEQKSVFLRVQTICRTIYSKSHENTEAVKQEVKMGNYFQLQI